MMIHRQWNRLIDFQICCPSSPLNNTPKQVEDCLGENFRKIPENSTRNGLNFGVLHTISELCARPVL